MACKMCDRSSGPAQNRPFGGTIFHGAPPATTRSADAVVANAVSGAASSSLLERDGAGRRTLGRVASQGVVTEAFGDAARAKLQALGPAGASAASDAILTPTAFGLAIIELFPLS